MNFGGGGATRKTGSCCDLTYCHPELDWLLLQKSRNDFVQNAWFPTGSIKRGKDFGSEAGMTNKKCSSLCPEVRSDEGRRMPCAPARHSDGSQSQSRLINSIRQLGQQKSRKAGFTMAEVLITLGIIGIVAAMTLPGLFCKYEKVKVASQIKKLYSVMSQAIRMAETEHGEFKYWTYNSSEELYYLYLSKYLNTMKVEYPVGLFGSFSNGIRFVFNDGTQIICTDKVNLAGYGNQVAIVSCIFYPKARSKWTSIIEKSTKQGTHELFWFLISERGTLEPPNLNKPREYNLQNCIYSDPATQAHYTDCSTLLYKDNWEFKEDYPW